VGEIAEALRKANEPVDGSRGETNPASRSNDETAGEITAALSRASSAKSPPSSADPEDAASSEPTSPREMSQAGASDIPDHLGKIIFHVERHRHLGLRLRTLLDQSSAPSLAVVSALRNEGKSIVCCNIAAAIASVTNQRSVALVDLDLRAPSLGNALRIMPKVGLEDVLAGKAPLCASQIRTDHPSLDVFLVKESRERAHELLVSEKLAQSIIELSGHYGTVIFDSPPALPVPDANIIAQQVGACVPIARAGVTRLAAFDSMRKALPAEKIIGAFLNKAYLEPVDCSYDK